MNEDKDNIDMELDDVINLSLFYRNKKGLMNFTPEEMISIGYKAYLETDKLYSPEINCRKTTYFMQILEWHMREEFRVRSTVKIPKWAWNKGVRTAKVEVNRSGYEKLKSYEPNFEFDKHEYILNACNELTERHKLIIHHKYELNGKEKLPLHAIAKKLNLSPQRVQVLHREALSELRKILK